MENHPPVEPATGLKRLLWLVAGFGMVGLAIIGAILPVMPTVIFLIGAAGCFARSSPKFEAKILNHPTFGPLVIRWRTSRAIPTRGKIMAVWGMTAGYGIFLWGARPEPALGVLVALCLMLAALYVISRPTA